jgi:hypothetical protein
MALGYMSMKIQRGILMDDIASIFQNLNELTLTPVDGEIDLENTG